MKRIFRKGERMGKEKRKKGKDSALMMMTTIIICCLCDAFKNGERKVFNSIYKLPNFHILHFQMFMSIINWIGKDIRVNPMKVREEREEKVHCKTRKCEYWYESCSYFEPFITDCQQQTFTKIFLNFFSLRIGLLNITSNNFVLADNFPFSISPFILCHWITLFLHLFACSRKRLVKSQSQ